MCTYTSIHAVLEYSVYITYQPYRIRITSPLFVVWPKIHIYSSFHITSHFYTNTHKLYLIMHIEKKFIRFQQFVFFRKHRFHPKFRKSFQLNDAYPPTMVVFPTDDTAVFSRRALEENLIIIFKFWLSIGLVKIVCITNLIFK